MRQTTGMGWVPAERFRYLARWLMIWSRAG
jgi:hypothetical protein